MAGKPPAPEEDVPPDEHLEDLLDEALDESFPASDPPAIDGRAPSEDKPGG